MLVGGREVDLLGVRGKVGVGGGGRFPPDRCL